MAAEGTVISTGICSPSPPFTLADVKALLSRPGMKGVDADSVVFAFRGTLQEFREFAAREGVPAMSISRADQGWPLLGCMEVHVDDEHDIVYIGTRAALGRMSEPALATLTEAWMMASKGEIVTVKVRGKDR